MAKRYSKFRVNTYNLEDRQVGDMIRLIRNGERFWVEIMEYLLIESDA